MPKLSEGKQSERINFLLKRQKKLINSYISVGGFDEPIAILLRRDGTAEFLQNVKEKELKIMHTDGEERKIWLSGQKLINFPHGKEKIKGYILHEDFPTPLPEDPLLTTEETGIAIDKTLYDVKKWKAEELKAKGKLIWYLLGGIAVIILAYALYVMLVPQEQSVNVINQTIMQTTTTLARVILNQ